jgi:hypothetical protein
MLVLTGGEMTGIDFGIDGECDVVRLAGDFYTVRLSVLMDSPKLPALVSLDVYARVDYASSRLDVCASVPQDGDEDAWGVTPELEAWCESYSLELFCAQLLQQEYDMECPS